MPNPWPETLPDPSDPSHHLSANHSLHWIHNWFALASIALIALGYVVDGIVGQLLTAGDTSPKAVFLSNVASLVFVAFALAFLTLAFILAARTPVQAPGLLFILPAIVLLLLVCVLALPLTAFSILCSDFGTRHCG